MTVKTTISNCWAELDVLLDEFEEVLDLAGDQAGLAEEGRWSLLDIGDHLFYAERKSLEGLKASENKLVKEPGLVQRLKLLWLLNFLKGRIKAKTVTGADPRQWSRNERHSDSTSLMRDFRKVREEFRAFLEQKDEAYFTSARYRHPVIGHIDVTGMMKFLRQHFDRHLGQARRYYTEMDQA